MTATTITPDEIAEPEKKSRFAEVISGMTRTLSGKIGLSLLIFHFILALSAPYIVPHSPLEQYDGLRLAAPSADHLLGTDRVGRDVLSRTMMGGRVALLVTVIGTIIAIIWSSLAGMLLGLVGGWIDDAVMRVVDAVQAIPFLLFLLLIIAIVGTETWILIATLGFFFGISPLRIFRNATLDFVARDFLVAARARGESMMTILRQELLPNILDIVLVEGAMRWSWMLLAFSSLSFLGFGVGPPTPDWGRMISESRGVISIAPWWTFSPVFALSSLIIAINLTADAVAKATGLDRAQGAPV